MALSDCSIGEFHPSFESAVRKTLRASNVPKLLGRRRQFGLDRVGRQQKKRRSTHQNRVLSVPAPSSSMFATSGMVGSLRDGVTGCRR